jgi:hypothetical protein
VGPGLRTDPLPLLTDPPDHPEQESTDGRCTPAHPTLGAEELEAALPPSVADLRGTAPIDGCTNASRPGQPHSSGSGGLSDRPAAVHPQRARPAFDTAHGVPRPGGPLPANRACSDPCTAMNGDVTADGTGEETSDRSPDSADGASGVLHVLTGYQASGAGLRAVCRCGHTGPPRTAADRAAAALDDLHQLDLLHCGICDRQRVPATILCRPEEVGLVIRPAVGGLLPDVEYLACADDLATCALLAAQIQQRLDRSAAEADAYCRRLLRRHLRLVR